METAIAAVFDKYDGINVKMLMLERAPSRCSAMMYEAAQRLKREGLPVKMTPSEAAYLAWIDATQISTEHR
jgi:hypothetical protein